MPWISRASVTLYQLPQVFVLTVSGEMDATEADLMAAAWEAAKASTLRTSVADLSGLTFADSTLLNTLVRAKMEHQADGRVLVLAGPLHSAVQQVLDLTGAAPYFTWAATLEEALARVMPSQRKNQP